MARRPSNLTLTYMPDEEAERVARVIGPDSACAQALEQCRRRRAAGEDVFIWRTDNGVLVGPDLIAAARKSENLN